jgi:S1-C subfamily serine protease
MRSRILFCFLAALAVAASCGHARSESFPGTAHYLDDNESKYLGESVTVHIEEGFSEIRQDESKPVDLAKTFFTCHTVYEETHKAGGIIYAAFPNEEAEQAQEHFDKFPERTRTLTGILKKTKERGNLYLDCKMADQKVAGSDDSKTKEPASEATTPPSKQISDEVKNLAIASTVVIRTGTGGGSGFVIEDEGRKFIVTNQHVLLGATKDELEVTTTDGANLVPVALQIVPDLDLARIEISQGPSPLSFATGANIDEAVATVGNSLDAGVITLNAGTIKGIGAGEIEVDCEVVPGQSGGPLINSAGEVIGVTTYILFADEDRATEDTRYAQKRYFTVRVTGETAWAPVESWAEYAKVGSVVQSGEEVFEQALDIAISADGGPTKDYNYAGRNRGLAQAANHHNRFVQKMTKMDGDVVTSMELDRNNASLAMSFRGVYKAVIEACKAEELVLRREINIGRAKRYPWLFERTEETAKMLSMLSQFLESRSKARPKFLSW